MTRDLVSELKKYCDDIGLQSNTINEICLGIEQLERELVHEKALLKHLYGQCEAIDAELSAEKTMVNQLAYDLGIALSDRDAEKALADRLYEEGVTSSRWDLPCYVAYRKARGL